MGAAHTHLTFSAPTPLQAGIAAALDADDGLESIGPLFSENFELLASALRAGTNVRAASAILVRVAPFYRPWGRFVPIHSAGHMQVRNICDAQGGYFLVAETDGSSDVDWCTGLAQEKGVVCTPMSVFYASDLFSADSNPCRLVRFTVCKSRAHIERACAALLRSA